MDYENPSQEILRFEDFELDATRAELRQSGSPVRLAPQPFQVLALLAYRAGGIVTREEIQRQLWKDDTFVDFEQGLNFCIRQIRSALGDDAGTPRFIQTIPRRGYRFVASIRKPAGEPSIAVLPLENLSSDPEQEYFADGLTEDLITELAHVSGLRVISRTSMMRYKRTRKSVPEIGVDHLIEGSVRRAGGRLRLSAQLIHAASDRHLWAQSYERNLDDVLGVQGELARSVAAVVRMKLSDPEQPAARTHPRVNPEAYERYLQGRHFFNRGTVWAIETSVGHFAAAIQADPQHAGAHVRLGNAWAGLCLFGARDSRELLPKIREAMETALALDPRLPAAHALRARLLMEHDRDWGAAEEEFREAIRLDPNSVDSHHGYSVLMMLTGRTDEALREIAKARELDPFSPMVHGFLGWISYSARRYDEAAEQLKKALALDRHYPPAQYRLAMAHALNGQQARAEARFKLLRLLSNDNARVIAAYGYVRARAGKLREASAILQKLQNIAATRHVSALDFALISAGIGDKDEAFAALDRAFQERDPYLPYFMVDPVIDDLRSDPRFANLVRRMNYPAAPAMDGPLEISA